MSSPGTPNQQYRTPESSPEPTEDDLRAIEASLDTVRTTLDEVVQDFSVHFDNVNELGELVHNLPEAECTVCKQPQTVPPIRRRNTNTAENGSSAVSRLVNIFENQGSRDDLTYTSPYIAGLPIYQTNSTCFKTSTFRRLSSTAMSTEDLSMGPGATGGLVDGTFDEPEEAAISWRRFVKFSTSTQKRVTNELENLEKTLKN